MARYVVCDNEEYIFCSEGALPSSSELWEQLPSRGLSPREVGDLPLSEEERRASLLSLHAYQAAVRRGYRREGAHALHTWIIARAKGPPGVFDDWFKGMPHDYRLMVHRFPRWEAGQYAKAPETCWQRTYDRLRMARRRQPSSEFAAPLIEFLHRVHGAYGENLEAVQNCFEETGHPYVRSFRCPPPTTADSASRPH